MTNISSDRNLTTPAVLCLAIGAALGMAGSLVPSAPLRAILWGIDGAALVVAAAMLAVIFFKRGEDLAAAGYIVFAVAQGLVVSGSAMSLTEAAPSFATGILLWAAALVMIGVARVYPTVVRLLGFAAAVLFAITALRILGGAPLDALSKPLPTLAYPVFVATMIGWIVTLLRKPAATE